MAATGERAGKVREGLGAVTTHATNITSGDPSLARPVGARPSGSIAPVPDPFSDVANQDCVGGAFGRWVRRWASVNRGRQGEEAGDPQTQAKHVK